MYDLHKVSLPFHLQWILIFAYQPKHSFRVFHSFIFTSSTSTAKGCWLSGFGFGLGFNTALLDTPESISSNRCWKEVKPTCCTACSRMGTHWWAGDTSESETPSAAEVVTLCSRHGVHGTAWKNTEHMEVLNQGELAVVPSCFHGVLAGVQQSNIGTQLPAPLWWAHLVPINYIDPFLAPASPSQWMVLKRAPFSHKPKADFTI